jgi:hypothetical protein
VVFPGQRWSCDERVCGIGSFTEATDQVRPGRVHSKTRLLGALIGAVVGLGRAAAEAAAEHGVSWRLARSALAWLR